MEKIEPIKWIEAENHDGRCYINTDHVVCIAPFNKEKYEVWFACGKERLFTIKDVEKYLAPTYVLDLPEFKNDKV